MIATETEEVIVDVRGVNGALPQSVSLGGGGDALIGRGLADFFACANIVRFIEIVRDPIARRRLRACAVRPIWVDSLNGIGEEVNVVIEILSGFGANNVAKVAGEPIAVNGEADFYNGFPRRRGFRWFPREV